MVTMSRVSFLCLILALLILLGYYIYTAILFTRAKMDKVTAKKFKLICKWEYRDPIKQEHVIIKEFVERYSQEKKINWDEYI